MVDKGSSEWLWISISMVPGISGYDFGNAIFNFALLIGIFESPYNYALRWMPPDLTDDKPTLVLVMAWCHQATSHYQSQCWPRSISPYGVNRPQRVNLSTHWGLNKMADIYQKIFFNCIFFNENCCIIDLFMQGARSSAAKGLTQFAWNIPVTVLQGWSQKHIFNKGFVT